MVWALDGAHMLGFPQMVDGQRLAELHGAVVVSISVRLGALGYLWLGDTLGHEFASSGNLGALDHEAGLRWVRHNIERFGGDPHSVTAFGISGAAGSTLGLMAMPSARGLFHRAIMQSGDQTLFRNFAQADLTTDAIFNALGLAPGERRRILELPVAQILGAQAQVIGMTRPLDQSTWFGPLVGTVLPEHPLAAFRRGVAADIPVIAGNVRDEFTYEIGNAPGVRALGETEVRQVFEGVFPGEGDEAVAAYRSFYGIQEWPFLLSTLFGDYQFGFGGIRIAAARAAGCARRDERSDRVLGADLGNTDSRGARGPGKTWIYHFQWPSPVVGPFGSRHGIDWAFAFDTLATGGGPVWLGPNPPQALADTMTSAWMNFADNGHPGPSWPKYNARTAPAMIFDAESQVDRNDPLAQLRGFWERSRHGIELGQPWVFPSP